VTVDDRVEAIVDRLRDGGGRATTARRATVRVLLSAGQAHLSAEDVIHQVHATNPEVADSTVYRTLSALEALGVVEHVHLGHGPSTYHLSNRPHQHLVCEHCGAVVEVPDAVFGGLATRIAEEYGFTIDPRHFAILGECRRCRDRRDRSAPTP